jgi:hypothetical protein
VELLAVPLRSIRISLLIPYPSPPGGVTRAACPMSDAAALVRPMRASYRPLRPVRFRSFSRVSRAIRQHTDEVGLASRVP